VLIYVFGISKNGYKKFTVDDNLNMIMMIMRMIIEPTGYELRTGAFDRHS